MKKSVYKYHDRDVIILGTELIWESQRKSQIVVSFCSLHSDGTTGKLKTRKLFESDFYDYFRRQRHEVELKWSTCE